MDLARIQSFEGLRGTAALLIALYHFQLGAPALLPLGHAYLLVDLFFVLSGYVMYGNYATRLASGGEVAGFLARRFGRLFPLLVFSTLCYLLIANAIVLAKQIAVSHGYAGLLSNPQALHFLQPSLAEMLSTLTMTHALGIFDHLILNTPSWSISVEFYTYLCFAAVCFFFAPKMRAPLFVLLAILGFAVSLWASLTLHNCQLEHGCLSLTYDFGLSRCIYSFSLGVLTCLLAHARSDVRQLPWWQILTLMLILALSWLMIKVPTLAFALPLAFAFLIHTAGTDSGPLAALLKLRPFQILGERSYSIYLMHVPLLLVVENVSRRLHSGWALAGLMLVYVAALLVISGWTYRYIENPCRLACNRLVSRFSRGGVGLEPAGT